MASLDQFVRSFTLFLGVTPPKPGQERRIALLILGTLVGLVAGSVALVLGMLRIMAR